MKYLRESGNCLIGDITWGTHIAQIYSEREEYLKMMVPFIDAGLGNNELCVWIYSDESDYKLIKEAMSFQVPYLEERIKSGQLLLMPYTEFYMAEGFFSHLNVLQRCNQLIHRAKTEGFDGLRVVGDSSWADKVLFSDILKYDNILNLSISEMPVIAACLYNCKNLDAYNMAQVLKDHELIIVKRGEQFELISNINLFMREKQIYESMEKYFQLVQLLPVAVFIHDADKIYYCNKAAVSLAEVKDSRELFGMKISDLFSGGMDYVNKYVSQTLDSDSKPNYTKTSFCCANGEVKPVEIISIGYLMNDQNVLLSVVRDVSPYYEINQLKAVIQNQKEIIRDTLEYDRIKTEFFSNISHELRTPLNVILSVIQLFKLIRSKSGSNEQEDRYLKMMQQNCYRLMRLINNLIDLTRIDSNYFEMHRKNIDIVNLVEQITMSVVEYGQNKGIAILFDTDIRNKVISCDPDHIERILLNLISNAIKFTDSGGEIWVKIKDCKNKIKISVKDTGIGIPLEKQAIIFNRFQRVDSSLTKRAEGSGIGLSLVKALVDMHNGTISLYSEVGRGSEFIIELPCEILPESDNNQPDHTFKNLNYVDHLNIELSDIYN